MSWALFGQLLMLMFWGALCLAYSASVAFRAWGKARRGER